MPSAVALPRRPQSRGERLGAHPAGLSVDPSCRRLDSHHPMAPVPSQALKHRGQYSNYSPVGRGTSAGKGVTNGA